MRALVIVPAHNEQDNIIKVINQLNQTGIDYVIINDGSTDETELFLKQKEAFHVNLISNLGIGGAVQTGYKLAKLYNYDIAIQFDGDGQHDIGSFKSVISPILNGNADMVIGSRFISREKENFKSTALRRIGINFLSALIYLITKNRIFDVTSGYRAINKDLIDKYANNYPSDYPEPESLVDVLLDGYVVEEVPATMHERSSGKSSITPLKSLLYMCKVTLAIIVQSLQRR